jgi:hypothetical protein
MNIIDKIRNVIEEECHYPIESEQLSILEPQNKGNRALKKVRLINVDSKNTFAFKFDHFPTSSNYLNGYFEGIHKGCDCVVFHFDGKKLNVLICELKSFNFNRLDVGLKYKATRTWIGYLEQLLVKLKIAESCEVEYKYFLFWLNKNIATRTEFPYEWLKTSEYEDIHTVHEISQPSAKNFRVNLSDMLK